LTPRLPARTRTRLAGVAVALLLAPLAACSQSEADALADSDGLVVYSGRNESIIAPLFERFEEETGIEVAVKYGSSANLAATLLEEGDKTPADLFLSQDAGALGALQEADLLAALPQATLDKVPAELRSREGRWVGVSGRVRVLVYNPDLVPASMLPKTVFDLAGPQWKDKLGWAPPNASFQAFVTALRVERGEDAAKQFLEALKANGTKSFEGNALIVDEVDAGRLAAGLVNQYYLAEKVAEKGAANVKAKNHYFPKGDLGGLVNVGGVGVLDDPDTDPRAQQFVDFLLGEAGQRFFADETKEYPLVDGFAADPSLPPFDSIESPDIDLSRLEDLEATLELLDEVGLT
jgi:iron(III) transport system substrate-binding protein